MAPPRARTWTSFDTRLAPDEPTDSPVNPSYRLDGRPRVNRLGGRACPPWKHTSFSSLAEVGYRQFGLKLGESGPLVLLSAASTSRYTTGSLGVWSCSIGSSGQNVWITTFVTRYAGPANASLV